MRMLYMKYILTPEREGFAHPPETAPLERGSAVRFFCFLFRPGNGKPIQVQVYLINLLHELLLDIFSILFCFVLFCAFLVQTAGETLILDEEFNSLNLDLWQHEITMVRVFSFRV